MKKLLTLVVLGASLSSAAQFNPNNSQFAAPAPNPQTFASNVDAAIGYNAWVLENNENSFKRIGAYKVKGTPYLYGAAYKGDVYAKKQVGTKVVVGYDTYQQQLEIYLGSKEPIVKSLSEIDSFVLRADSITFFKEDLYFKNAQLFDSSKSFFVVEIYQGERFSLYKAYYSELGVVSENYVQSELRQFDLNVDFYYHDANRKGLHKMKLTPKYLRTEFNAFIDVKSALNLENLNRSPQSELLKLILMANEQAKN